MARAPELLGLEPYCRRDPVTGRQRCYWRVRHDVTRSPRLARFRECLGDELRGRRYRTGSAEADSQEVRAAFRAAAAGCSRRTAEPHG